MISNIYVIDTQGDRGLTPAESTKSFKHCTDLPEEFNLCGSTCVMFLDKSLIQHRISNGITGITELLHGDADNISVYPIVIFPTENDAEILTPLIL